MSSTSADSETKQLWSDALDAIKEPPIKCRTWNPSRAHLAAVIVEPRSHPWLRAVLYNMAHVYGGTDVALHIFHGSANADFVKDICADWSGVIYHDLKVENLTPVEYSILLTSDFWENIDAEFALIFQTDTLIRRPIDPEFFEYDYVGAPWPFYVSYVLPVEKHVGNGGFSLRRISSMRLISCINGPTYPPLAEDVFFAERVAIKNLPTVTIACKFSVEHIWHEDPCGLHQTWCFHSSERINELLANLPGI